MKDFLQSKLIPTLTVLLLVSAFAVTFAASGPGSRTASETFPARGNLDCNGFSKIQKLLRTYDACTDPTGYDGTRFYDNGHYIGHDEPAAQFNSTVPGSGNNVQYTLTLPRERPLPATQTFQNGVAFWFSMALCDPNSFPNGACLPDSDQNTPSEAGSAFLEMQFYPPGETPFLTNISCDLHRWCASLHINSLEVMSNGQLNPNCTEPTNFAFIQKDGIPTGPPGPDTANDATATPNAETLLMNQGDTLRVTINDTPGDVFGGVTTRIDDLSTGQSGFMIASAHNGYRTLNRDTCAGTDFSFHPEFSTAKFGNFVPWAALQANIGFSDEIGHWENGANGDGGDSDDVGCFPSGPGNLLAGCLGSDIDFDGTPYQADWPDGSRHAATPVNFTSPHFKATGGHEYDGVYPIMQLETDVLASEATCQPNGVGCGVPPPASNVPGASYPAAQFYPFFSVVSQGDYGCTFLFGNNTRGVDDFGKDAQYGAPNLPWFFGTASGGPMANPCVND
jgi:hypothetical protein